MASIVSDGLVFEIDAAANTAKLVGTAAVPPKGELSVPASVTSGATTYEVTSLEKNAFAKCPELASVSLPATLREIDPDALAGCISLTSITVSTKSEAFSASDGMLFTKDYSKLLLIPEGKEGAAAIPGRTSFVPTLAFSRCLGIPSLTVGDGGAEFSTQGGMLFTSDLKTLVVCPPASGNAVVLPAETESIGEYALAGCKELTSITALGNVREINATAFADEVKATAVVALPAGEDYDERKAVWEAAGFQHFAEPAEPGATSRPEADAEAASGLVYTLLDDYTLSVAWEGGEDPAAEVEIPASAEIGGVSYRVSAIADGAFANRASLTSVKVPASVTSVGEAAFAACANLTSVSFSDSVREIGERAFEATSLADIWLPASVQSIGPRAFASCDSLTRIVALGTPEVADDALAACANLSIYCPYNAENTYPWNLGLIANNNHLLPYGLMLSEEPLHLEVGQSANLFDNGLAEAPEGCEVSYSYAAKPISVVPDGTVTAKALGTSEVTATLTLNNIELTRTTRTVEVKAAETPQTEDLANPETPTVGELTTSEPTIESAQFDLMNTAAAVDDPRQLSLTATLSTDQSFEQMVASGQTLKFTVLADGTSVSVAKSDNEALAPVGDIVIPATVTEGSSTYTVTELATEAFWNCLGLTSVRFEQGSQVKRLNDGALGAIRTLRYVELPGSLETIGANMFQFAVSLQRVDIPDSVQSIGERLFIGCSSLADVYLGSGITGTFPANGFTDCVSLQTIVSKGNFSLFMGNAFDFALTENTKVYVASEAQRSAWVAANSTYYYGFNPDNILIEGQFFKVTVDAGEITSLYNVVANAPMEEPRVPQKEGKSIEGWYTDASLTERWNFDAPVTHDMTLHAKWADEIVDGNYLYRMRSDGQSLSLDVVDKSLVGGVTIPVSHMFGESEYPVVEIADYAFRETDITAVSIPASVKVIGIGGFSKCASLQSVDIASDSVLECISADAFSSSPLLRTFWVPSTIKHLGRASFYNCMGLESFTFEEGITELKALMEATFKQTSITSIELPDSITHIQEEAIRTCQKLKSVKLPKSLEVLGRGAFYSCTALTSVELPSTLKQVSNSVFAECTSLQTISLPAGLEVLQLPDTFKSCTSLSLIRASGSMSAVGASITDAFIQEQKDAITVVLPEVGGSGESFTQMEEAWTSYGFSKFSPMGGALPLASDAPDLPNTDEKKGGWTLSDDGTLTIHSTEKIANFNWHHTANAFKTEHWGPVRSLVKSVDTTGVHSVDSMWAWFRNMPNLTDISRFVVPEGTIEVVDVFTSDKALTEIPATLTFPDSVTNLWACFNSCSSIKEIPKSFKLPPFVTNVNYLFGGNPNLTKLPDGFLFPDTITDMQGFFSEWTALTTLPEGFTLPPNVQNVTGLFSGCSALCALPDGFSLPSSVTNAVNLFRNCTSLLSLPSSFKIPQTTDTQVVDIAAAFKVNDDLLQGEQKVPLYYAGNDPVVLGQTDAWWAASNRTLITPKNKLEGASTITLNIKNEGEAGEGMFWSAVHTDASGLLTEPAYVPSRPGMVFTLWYTDPECTQRADFTKPFDADSTIYGKLAPGTRGAALPCEAGTGSAAWSFADDGTLYIRGAGEVSNFGWEWNSELLQTDHWGPVRDLVKRIAMDPSLKAKCMRAWFMRMPNLINVSEVFIPQGAEDVSRFFQECTSLEGLPEGFAIPENVTQTMAMFENCWSLASVPSSLFIPDTVTNLIGMFVHCKSLSSLPEGFKLSKKADWFVEKIFEDCPLLTALPKGFTFPNVAYTSSTRRVFYCDLNADGSRVPMYYAGDDPAVLNYDWTSMNRTLITTGEGATDKGLYPVEYKVMDPDTNTFETSASVFTTGDGLVPDLGTLQKLGYGFIGWFADEDCLEAFDFSRPVTEATTLYAKWAKHGGKGTDEGMLPTENPDGTTGQDAWWGIATDGALHIVCDNGSSVAPLGFAYNVQTKKYWEPYLNDVYSLCMERKVKASDMTSWFQKMPNLTSIDKGFFFPENCTSARWLFYYNEGLQVLPQGFFDGAAELRYTGGMLQNCSALTTLPADFMLPTKVSEAWCLLYGTGISALPEGFKLREGLTYFNSMFAFCKNLTTLPEDFKIPSTASEIDFLFYTCPNLTALPAHLFENVIKMPEDGEFRQKLKLEWDVFGFKDESSLKPDPDPLPTYFPASDEEIALIGDWSAQHRTIVKADSPGRQHIASLWLPNDTGDYTTVWKTLYANASNVIEVAPAAAPRTFQTFKGWYLDEECTDPATFPLKLDKDIYLYALYETTGGTLPTINPDGTEGQGAQWSYDQDTHVLKIESTVPGAKIKKLFQAPTDDAHASPKAGYWSPFRSQVQKVQMGQGVLVGGDDGVSGDMNYWFSGMYGLTSLNGVYVPESTVSLDHTFNMCTSLAALPGTFTLPDSLTNMTGTFRGCQFKTLPDGFKLPPYLKRAAIIFGENLELVSLPEGFALPEGVIDANYLFWNCPKLKQLPSSFLLPTNLSNASAMFGGCAALTSLPAGFTIPASTNQEKKIDLSSMFTRCTTLAALPEGFSIPDSSRVSEVTNMFRGCSALTSLPASLDLTGLQGVLGVETLFAPAADATEITTYYAGSDLAKLSVDGGDATAAEAYWKDNYKRNLVVTNGGTSMPEGTCTVNFMIPDTTGNSNYTLWQSVVVAQGSALVDPQLASRYGVAFEGWFDGEGKEVVFGTAIEPNATTMTLYARFTAPILKATAPASAKITVDASGTITKAPLRLTSQTAAPVWVSQAVATPNIEADTAVKPSALADLSLVMRPPIGKGTLVIFLDGGISRPTRDDTFTIPTATGVATPGVLDCSIDVEGLNPADVLFHRDGLSTGLADITFTFELAK